MFRELDEPHAELKEAKAILAARNVSVLNDREISLRTVAAVTRCAAADCLPIRDADLGRFTPDWLGEMRVALDESLGATLQVDAIQTGRPLTATAWQWFGYPAEGLVPEIHAGHPSILARIDPAPAACANEPEALALWLGSAMPRIASNDAGPGPSAGARLGIAGRSIFGNIFS